MSTLSAIIFAISILIHSAINDIGVVTVLNNLNYVMTGDGGGYDWKSVAFIRSAMDKFDVNIFESQNAGWRGLVEYYEAGGGTSDSWGSDPSE